MPIIKQKSCQYTDGKCVAVIQTTLKLARQLLLDYCPLDLPDKMTEKRLLIIFYKLFPFSQPTRPHPIPKHLLPTWGTERSRYVAERQMSTMQLCSKEHVVESEKRTFRKNGRSAVWETGPTDQQIEELYDKLMALPCNP